ETWRLGESIPTATNSHFRQSFSAAVVVSPAHCTISPGDHPSRARTNARIYAPRMPQRPTIRPLPVRPPKNPPHTTCIGSLMPPSSFFSSRCPRSLFLSDIFLWPSDHHAMTRISPTPALKPSQPVTSACHRDSL